MTASPSQGAAAGALYGRRAGGIGARGWTPAIVGVTSLGVLGVVGALLWMVADRAAPKRLTDPQPEAVFSTGVAVVKPAPEAMPPPPRNSIASAAHIGANQTAQMGAREGGGAAASGAVAQGAANRGGAMVVYTAPANTRAAALEASAPALETAKSAPARATRQSPGVRAERLARLDALLAEGTLIAVTLETALNSDLPGPIRGIVAADVLSFDASQILIPKGARLIGEYRAGLVRGRARLFAVWTRILTPDGVSVALTAPAMDGEGRVGIGGRRDAHFFERFGGAMILSLVDAGALAAADRAAGESDSRIVITTGRDARRAAELALENSITIPPTLRAPAGAALQAFVNRDVDFSDVLEDDTRMGDVAEARTP